MNSPWSNLRLQKEDFVAFGQGLTRPECVWIDADGVWVRLDAALTKAVLS